MFLDIPRTKRKKEERKERRKEGRKKKRKKRKKEETKKIRKFSEFCHNTLLVRTQNVCFQGPRN